MSEQLDAVDAKILDLIQHDAGLSVAEIAERVGLSSSPCWRRIKRLEDSGVIQRRVSALSTLHELDPREVRDAFWLGYALAAIYRPAIACAAARAAGRTCPLPSGEAADGAQEVRCLSLDAVLAR